MRRRIRSGCAGFTLLELLIALTLISLILVMLFGGLRLGSRTWDGVENKARATEAQRLARGFVRRSLLQARKVLWQFDTRSHVLFWGDEEQLEFASPLSGYVGIGGMYVLRLALVEHEGRRDLILQRWLLNQDVLDGRAADIPQWQPLQPPGAIQVPEDGPMGVYGSNLLLEDVGGMQIAYFGVYPGERESTWHEEWKEQPRLPQLVRIRLEHAEDWPEMIVPLVDG